MRVDFVGLGRMGLPMCGRLQAAGYDVKGWDIDPAALARAAQAEIAAVSNFQEIGTRSDTVVLCLPGPDECADVIEGPAGLLEGLNADGLVINTSTIGQADAKRWADAFAANRGISYIDAPITGGEVGALDGTLTIFVGGAEASFERSRPILETFGQRIEYVGPAGTGAAIKLTNQAVYLTYCVSLAEAVAGASRAGVDPARLLDLLASSAAGDPLATGWYQRLATHERAPGFSIERAAKDISLFRELTSAESGEHPISDALLDLLQSGIDAGIGELDIAALADEKPAK